MSGVLVPLIMGLTVLALQVPVMSFPFWYHWDEESKALQIVDETRNLRHPLLMLHVVDGLHRVCGRSLGLQATTELGRFAAASAMAGMVAVMARLAHGLAGPAASLCVGVFIGLMPEMVHYGHYFKEDPFFLLGWSLVLWSLSGYRTRPGWRRALLVGVAAGLCASGKHVGWLALPASVGALLFMEGAKRRRGAHAGLLIAAACGAWLLLNHAFLSGWLVARVELQREVSHLLHEHNSAPHAIRMFARLLPAAWWAGLAFFAWRVWAARGLGWVERVALVFAGLYLCLLYGATRLSQHYVLPLWMTAGWLAALGVGGWLEDRIPPRGSGWRRGLALAVPVLVLAAAVCRGGIAWRTATGPDHRLMLARHLDAELPLAAVVYDMGVNLPDPRLRERNIAGWTPRTWVAPLYRLDLLPGPDPLDALVAQGFSHVAIQDEVVHRYGEAYDAGSQPSVLFADEALRPAFYEALRTRGTQVWRVDGVRGRLLRPTLTLYRLPTASP